MNLTNILDDTDKLIYSVYRSKYNRECINTLKYDMTLNEFLKHREFTVQQDDLELASHKDHEASIKK